MVTRNRKKEKPYLERDISWMYFNRRILQEATRSHVPLLERMAFLGIYSNNLDEFFRVRVASQSRIAECMDKSAAKEREKAKKLLKQIGKLNARYVKDYGKCGPCAPSRVPMWMCSLWWRLLKSSRSASVGNSGGMVGVLEGRFFSSSRRFRISSHVWASK